MAKILIVDDEMSIRSLIKRVLEIEGHTVVEVKNGMECFEVIEDEHPDLILMDVMMPGDNGWEVCRKIKQVERTKGIPVVICTVKSSREDMKKSLEYALANGHINKPFFIKEFIKA